MKTKRRHELQTNQLADWLGTKMQAVRPYTQVIVGVAIVVGLLVAVIIYFSVRSKRATEAEWAALSTQVVLQTPKPTDLEQVNTNFPNSQAGLWALLRAADVDLNEGVDQLYGDRTRGISQLNKAKTRYRTVVDEAGEYPMLHRRARFGLGVALEALGDLDKAKEQFQTLVDNAGDTAVGAAAGRRLERLEDASIQSFYEAFIAYREPEDKPREYTMGDLPARPELTFPGDNLPLPERPQIEIPNLDELLKADETNDADETDGTSETDDTDDTDGTEPTDAPQDRGTRQDNDSSATGPSLDPAAGGAAARPPSPSAGAPSAAAGSDS